MKRCGGSCPMPEQLGPAPRAGIARRNRGHRPRPCDSQFSVGEVHCYVLPRIMWTVDPVTDVRRGSQSLESVQKSARDEEMTKVVVIENKCPVLAESRRPAADIDNDVIDRAVRAPDQFGLAEPRTAMESPDHALCRSGLRILDQRRRGACRADEVVEQYGVKSSGEKTASVIRRLGYENRDTGEVGLFNSHGDMLP